MGSKFIYLFIFKGFYNLKINESTLLFLFLSFFIIFYKAFLLFTFIKFFIVYNIICEILNYDGY
jgi:hypothetical protein